MSGRICTGVHSLPFLAVCVVAVAATVLLECHAEEQPPEGAAAERCETEAAAEGLSQVPCPKEGTADYFATFGKWAPLKHGERRKVCIRGEPDIEVEGLSEASPTAFLVRGLLKDREIAAVLRKTEPHLKPSLLTVQGSQEKQAGTRWRSSTMLTMSAKGGLRSLNARISQLLRMPVDLVINATLQVQRYDGKDRYLPHYDSRRLASLGKEAGSPGVPQGYPFSARVLTIVLYLDTPSSGHTIFPFSSLAATHTRQQVYDLALSVSPQASSGSAAAALWEKYCRDPTKHGGLAVKPKKGDAVVFFNHELEQGADGEAKLGELDPFSFHGGCVVKDGETKTMMNYWVHVDPAHFADVGSSALSEGGHKSAVKAVARLLGV